MVEKQAVIGKPMCGLFLNLGWVMRDLCSDVGLEVLVRIQRWSSCAQGVTQEHGSLACIRLATPYSQPIVLLGHLPFWGGDQDGQAGSREGCARGIGTVAERPADAARARRTASGVRARSAEPRRRLRRHLPVGQGQARASGTSLTPPITKSVSRSVNNVHFIPITATGGVEVSFTTPSVACRMTDYMTVRLVETGEHHGKIFDIGGQRELPAGRGGAGDWGERSDQPGCPNRPGKSDLRRAETQRGYRPERDRGDPRQAGQLRYRQRALLPKQLPAIRRRAGCDLPGDQGHVKALEV